MYGYVVCVCVCVHVLDPVVQLMVFMCILVRSHAKSQVWVTVAGQNAKTGRWADFAWWKKKVVNVVTNLKDSCDLTSYPYVKPKICTIMWKDKITRTVISSSQVSHNYWDRIIVSLTVTEICLTFYTLVLYNKVVLVLLLLLQSATSSTLSWNNCSHMISLKYSDSD